MKTSEPNWEELYYDARRDSYSLTEYLLMMRPHIEALDEIYRMAMNMEPPENGWNIFAKDDEGMT